MSHIETCATPTCPRCRRARTLSCGRAPDVVEVDVTSDSGRAVEMIRRSARTTVPQIVIDDVAIAGRDAPSCMPLPDRHGAA